MRHPKSLGKKYLRRATKRFLEGARCQTPFDAVLKGIRTHSQWAEILGEERELELELLRDRRLTQLEGAKLNLELGLQKARD